MPRNEPSAVPRSTAAQERLKSSLVGHRFFTSLVKISRLSFNARLATISAVPNMPIATMTKPMPSESSGMLKVKRSTPELTSVPTMPSSRPKTTIAIALMSEPCASTVAATRPNTISEKYSDGPNLSATSASGGDRKSTRLNSSHGYISYAVFCLKKKKKKEQKVEITAISNQERLIE